MPKSSTNYVVFKNNYKENENQPDYKVYLQKEKGEEKSKYSIGAIWKRVSKNGKKYMSMVIDDEEYVPEKDRDEDDERPSKKSSLKSKLKSRRGQDDLGDDDDDEDEEEDDDEEDDDTEDEDDDESDKDKAWKKRQKRKMRSNPFK